MKKVVVTGAEEVINALQDGKILYIDIFDGNGNKIDFVKYWLYKGIICKSVGNCTASTINEHMLVLPEYEYYYYENGGNLK